MKVFYWVMGVLIVGTLVPSLFYWALYAFTGEDTCAQRARKLWTFTRLFALLGFNTLVWGHVAVGLWQLWRH